MRVFIFASQKELYLSGISFRELKKFSRELNFALADFNLKNVILLTLQSTRNLMKWTTRAIKTYVLTKLTLSYNH